MKYNHQVATILQINNNNFEKKIKEALAQNQITQNILEDLDNEKDYEEQDGILTY